jgi:hypothetical protein
VNKYVIEVAEMKKHDIYLEIAGNLSDYIKNQRGIVDEIQRNINSLGIFSSLKLSESLFSKLDEINSLKSLLPKIDFGSRTLQLIRQTNEGISKLSLSTQFPSLINQTANIPDAWTKQFADMPSLSGSIEPFLMEIQSQIARISEISILAERTLALIDFSKIFEEYIISDQLRIIVRDADLSFIESYSDLFKSFEGKQFGILSFPPIVSTIPPIEFYFNNRLIRPTKIIDGEPVEDTILANELTREISSEMEILLTELNPELITLWRGARDALKSGSRDALRHFSVSLRELLTHVIHRLAPDDRIVAWSTSPDDLHNGRPTRRARLLYICRGINLPPFDDFVLKDIDALLACIRVFEKGTHEISPSFRESQTDLLLSRVESNVRFLIKTWKETK